MNRATPRPSLVFVFFFSGATVKSHPRSGVIPGGSESRPVVTAEAARCDCVGPSRSNSVWCGHAFIVLSEDVVMLLFFVRGRFMVGEDIRHILPQPDRNKRPRRQSDVDRGRQALQLIGCPVRRGNCLSFVGDALPCRRVPRSSSGGIVATGGRWNDAMGCLPGRSRAVLVDPASAPVSTMVMGRKGVQDKKEPRRTRIFTLQAFLAIGTWRVDIFFVDWEVRAMWEMSRLFGSEGYPVSRFSFPVSVFSILVSRFSFPVSRFSRDGRGRSCDNPVV